jgi:hypothetical protein
MEENKEVVLNEQDFVEDEEVVDEVHGDDTKSETKKPQTKEENSYYANLRRRNKELEEKNKQLEKEKGEADFSARKKVISADTMADLGLDSIEDENDLLLCEEYDKAVKRGSENPILDATKAYRSKVKTERTELAKAEQKKLEQDRLVQEDMANFKKEFGITTKQALEDERFVKAFGEKIEFGNMSDLYRIYKSLTSSEDEQDQKESKRMGKVPSSGNAHKSKPNINDLDGEDFLKAFNEMYH